MRGYRSQLARRAIPVLIAGVTVLAASAAVHGADPSAVPVARPLAALDLRALGNSAPVPPDPVRTGPAAPAPKPRAATRPRPALLVRIRPALPITARPGGGPRVGVMPADSLQFGFPTFAWVISVSPNGRYGRVPIPYSGRRGTGWIRLRGLQRSHTPIVVRADLSKHQIEVERAGRVILRTAAATGRPSTPTPTGLYFVTDRVPFSRWSYYGSFAFGISGLQTHLPAGWRGGTQLAIHGTNNPTSIGRAASAGCLRVSERTLAILRPLLKLGTPVIIER